MRSIIRNAWSILQVEERAATVVAKHEAPYRRVGSNAGLGVEACIARPMPLLDHLGSAQHQRMGKSESQCPRGRQVDN